MQLWDANAQLECKVGRTRGKQVYLGGFNDEETAATVYDIAALRFWGESAPLNFPAEQYSHIRPYLPLFAPSMQVCENS
jgi:AP2-like factor (ANT lineage)